MGEGTIGVKQFNFFYLDCVLSLERGLVMIMGDLKSPSKSLVALDLV